MKGPPDLSRRGRPCVLCTDGVSGRRGEHAWPQWLFAEQPHRPNGYVLLINGEQQRNRNDQPISHSAAARVNLPMCPSCNGILDARFEKPAKELVRKVVAADGHLTMSATEARTFATWMAKTMLLLAHPLAIHSHLQRGMATWTGDIDPALYQWMIDGSEPPAHLSLWVRRRSADPTDGDRIDIMRPEVHANGEVFRTRHKFLGLGSLAFDLVHHPPWTVDNPLEAEGAVLILPREVPLDLTSLPVVSMQVRWVGNVRLYFGPDQFDPPRLPVLGPETDFDLTAIAGLSSMAWCVG